MTVAYGNGPEIKQNSRKVTVHGVDKSGGFSIELLLDLKHQTFGEYADLTTKSSNPPKIRTIYAHLMQVINTCLESKDAIAPPILLTDYKDDCRLKISVDIEKDDVENETLIVFAFKSVPEEIYRIPRHVLKPALAKLKEAHEEKMTTPAEH